MKDETVLLYGIVGSTAYGLGTPSSDVDRLGIFASPTRDILGLHPPTPTKVMVNPDITLHETGKYCTLALRANPTVMELMWLPDDLYEVRSPYGQQLIDIREAFLSAPYVRNAYLGYAAQQFKKLESRSDGTFGPDLAKRTSKHARHMYRLLIQGFELWSTGKLTIRLDDPGAVMSFGARVSLGDPAAARDLLAQYEEAFDSTPTVLPECPDDRTVEEWLLSVRGVS